MTPNTVISHRKMYNASAHGAMVDACCGHIAEEVSHLVRNCQSTGLIPIVCLYSSCPFSRSVLLFSGDSGRGALGLGPRVPAGQSVVATKFQVTAKHQKHETT